MAQLIENRNKEIEQPATLFYKNDETGAEVSYDLQLETKSTSGIYKALKQPSRLLN